MDERKTYKFLRITGLIVGCIGMGVSGSVYAFNAYANAVKKTFNYTQTEAELLASMSNFGNSLGFLAGLMVERLGPRYTSFTGLILTSLGSFLLYSTTFEKRFYSHHAWLQDIYFFLTGFGAIFIYMSGMMTNIANFSPRHRGKVIGLLDASFSCGPSLVALVYGTLFTNGHIHDDEEKQNLRGFYFMMALLFAISNLLAVIFLTYYPADHAESSILINSDELTKILEKRDEHPNPEPVHEITGCKLLKTFDYQYLMWGFIISSSLQIMFQNNITTYLKSFHMQSANTLFTTLTFAVGTVAKFVTGFVSDVIVHRVPRPAVAMVSMTIQTVALTLCIFYGDVYGILLTGVIFIGIANGATWCLTPTMTSEFFGITYFGRNWGFMMIGTAFGGLILQNVFGVLYDSQITVPGVIDCYGLPCFHYSFIIVSVLSICTVVLYLGLFERRFQLRKDVKEKEQNNLDTKSNDSTSEKDLSK